MTYNVFGGTLNLAQSVQPWHCACINHDAVSAVDCLLHTVKLLMVLSCHLIVSISRLVTRQLTHLDISSTYLTEHHSKQSIPCSQEICSLLAVQVTSVYLCVLS